MQNEKDKKFIVAKQLTLKMQLLKKKIQVMILQFLSGTSRHFITDINLKFILIYLLSAVLTSSNKILKIQKKKRIKEKKEN